MLWRWQYKNLQHFLQGNQDMTIYDPDDAMPIASALGGLLYDLHVQPLSRRTFEDKGTASWNWILRCFMMFSIKVLSILENDKRYVNVEQKPGGTY